MYPDIKRLAVTLIGMQLDPNHQSECETNDNITVKEIIGLVEDLSITQLNTYHISIIITPGQSELKYFNMWRPAINNLRDTSLLTIVTSYSHYDRDSNDAIFDEPTLYNYFNVNILLPSSTNIWGMKTLV